VLGNLAGGCPGGSQAILGDAARGVDTAAERKEARLKAAGDGLTLADLIDQWDKLHLSAKRVNYSTAAISSLRRSFAHHLDKPAAAVDRSAVVRVLDRLFKDDRAAMAAATARYGSALYGWAIRRGTLSANPFSACLPPRPFGASACFRTTRYVESGSRQDRAHSTASPGRSCSPGSGAMRPLFH
jgi:hypothetical protein